LLANPSLQLLIYKIGLREDMGVIANMEHELERLRGLEEAEKPLKANQVEFLQDQVTLLTERCRKYKKEIDSLKDNVALLGKAAKLIRVTTLPMGRNFYQDGEVDKKLHLIRLRKCVEKVATASQMMVEMTQLMERVSAQE
jgi:hypothetical protein